MPGSLAQPPCEIHATAQQTALLSRFESVLPQLRADAAELDKQAAFPKASMQLLREAGLLSATVPVSLGGAGFGIGEAGATALARLLGLVAQASLPVARLYEAHINALQLIQLYGDDRQAATAAGDAAAGHLFGLWVTDRLTGPPVRLEVGRLSGVKAFCSGAGAVTRALITAETAAGAQMIVIALPPGERVIASDVRLAGMRAAVTGSVDLAGLAVPEAWLIGEVGDYLREPLFSAGAWRGSAAAWGGLVQLAALFRQELLRRGRGGDPHQRARFGQVMAACETARLWVEQAARRACVQDRPADEIVAFVNLARIAVEGACLDGMRHVQRGLGISGFLLGQPAELVCRDLATFLRQPAPDETLDTAAAFYLRPEAILG